MRRSAFTLIEVLVVVAIIALLVAILLPSLSRARQQARSAMCLSNMRSMAMAVHLYANANQDRLVTVGYAHGGSVDEHAAWFNTLRHIYRDHLVAQCPSDQSPHFTQPEPVGGRLRKTSFGTNWYTVAEVGGRGPYDRLGKFKRSATTIYIAELAETGQYAASDHYHAEQWFTDPRRLASEQLAIDRHSRKANYAFIDSHAEPLFFERTYSIDVAKTVFPKIAWRHNLHDPAVAY
ncbi:MAG: hypothetical protein AMXMBFR13_41770 [Phycisphaerae bacterium]